MNVIQLMKFCLGFRLRLRERERGFSPALNSKRGELTVSIFLFFFFLFSLHLCRSFFFYCATRQLNKALISIGFEHTHTPGRGSVRFTDRVSFQKATTVLNCLFHTVNHVSIKVHVVVAALCCLLFVLFFVFFLCV